MKSLRNILLFIATICISDLIFGTLFIPASTKNFFDILTIHPYYNQGFEKNKTGVIRDNNFYPLYFTNSLGMKDRAIRAVPLTTAKHRILFIGDSFTEGAQYPFDSTYCGFLNAKVDTSKVEILNGGIRAAGPKLYYLKLDYLLNHQHLQVNDVYCMVGYTNISDELVYQHFQPKLPDEGDGNGFNIKRFLITHSAIYQLCSKALVKCFCMVNHIPDELSYLYWVKTDNDFNKETNYNFSEFKARWATPEMINMPVTQKALNLSKENLKKTQALCMEHGIKFHLIFYPIAALIETGGIDFKLIQTTDNTYLSIWQNFAAQNNIDFINLFPLFTADTEAKAIVNRNKYYIPDDNHWNWAGHQRAADSLYCIINR